ncbi:MAG: hypothetical protein NZ518_11305, partial [Dehalococcoidia bacterium]|nr:hypothetical protein [Dehalococcoidia bacterium]
MTTVSTHRADAPTGHGESIGDAVRRSSVASWPWRGGLLAGAFVLFAVGPLLYPGWIATHRGVFAAYEVVGLAVSPAWWWVPTVAADPTLAQGPIPYWLARSIVWFGASPVDSIRWVMAISFALLGVGVYALIHCAIGHQSPRPVRWSALVGSV